MALSLHVAVELTQMVCGECAGVYAIAERVRQKHHDNGSSWTCPYCRCGWGYSGQGKLQLAEKALEEERKRHSNTLSRLNEAAGERDKAQRQLKRVKRGVCPCCKRSFTALGLHMATMHPDYEAKP